MLGARGLKASWLQINTASQAIPFLGLPPTWEMEEASRLEGVGSKELLGVLTPVPQLHPCSDSQSH